MGAGEALLDYSKMGGLIAAVVQDWQTDEVLMVAYLNEEAFARTQETGRMHYWSRSRNKLWMKGESSGHVQEVQEMLVDCDGDAVLFKVKQLGGAACHTGYRTCFYRRMDAGGETTLVQPERVFDPAEVYGK